MSFNGPVSDGARNSGGNRHNVLARLCAKLKREPERLCQQCGAVLVKRPGEQDANWRRRVTCNRACGGKRGGLKRAR